MRKMKIEKWQCKNSALIIIFLAVSFFASIMIIGCSPEPEQQEVKDAIPAGPQGEMDEMPMARVAEILGIEQQELIDAFAQAQSEVRETPLEEYSPDLMMSRVAEILGIEQKALEDATAQVRSEMPADSLTDSNRGLI